MFDFPSITTKTFKYNFHSHTQYCDGRDVMEHFVQKAIEFGFEHYGFSPHSPIPFFSTCNMTKTSVYEYLCEVDRLKSIYGDAIQLYASMEIDYIDDYFNASSDYFQSLPLDYRIGSLHFLPSQDGIYVDIDGKFDTFKHNVAEYFHNDLRYVIDTFFDHSFKMLQAGGFDIVGHLDKISQNANYYKDGIETENWFVTKINDMLDLIKQKGYTIEINTKALEEHKRVFPNSRYFKRIKDMQIPVVFNSDTHYVNRINAGRDDTKSLFDSI